MKLNKDNFIKYIIFLGVIYGAIILVNNREINKKKMLLILVGSLIIMIVTDYMFSKSESMSNVWKQAKELDNIDLTFSSPQKSDKLAKKVKQLELIKISSDSPKSTEEEEEELTTNKTTEEEEEELTTNKTTEEESEEKAKEEKRTKAKEERRKKAVMSLDLNEKPNCAVEVAKIKRKLETDLRMIKKELMVTRDRMDENRNAVRYMNMLAKNLKEKGIIDKTDLSNLNAKLASKLLTRGEIIESLERLSKDGKPRKNTSSKKIMNAMKYSERPSKNYEPIGKGVSKWSNDYTILNTDKWTVPMYRPPVCISTNKCKVCPSATDGYPVGLKDWDNSRKVTNIKVNKKWTNDQVDVTDDEMLIKDKK